jgi:hypothetical protein
MRQTCRSFSKQGRFHGNKFKGTLGVRFAVFVGLFGSNGYPVGVPFNARHIGRWPTVSGGDEVMAGIG